MTETRDIMKELAQNLPQIDESLGLPTLEFDYELYRNEMNDYDVSEEQAKEFLSTLFYIIHTIVDINLGLDITQMFNSDLLEKTSQDSGNTLPSKNTILLKQSTPSFNEAAHTTDEED